MYAKNSGTAASGREKAYAYLRENILIDPEMQGRFLNEQELAAEIGVSRTPVREALLLLVSDGLVELIPAARRLRSAGDRPRNVRTDGTARGPRKPRRPPGHRAAQRCRPRRCRTPWTSRPSFRTTSAPEAAREFIRLDTLFHQQLIDAAGNELISRTYSKLHVRQILVGVSALFRAGGRREQVCAEHQDILDALVSGDAAKAQEAIDHHLAVTRDILLRT